MPHTLPPTTASPVSRRGRGWGWLTRHLSGQCEICRDWSARPWCATCLSLHGQERARCPRCAMPQTEGRECLACRREPPPYAQMVVAFDYAFPWDGLIRQLKYADRPELARPLGEALTNRVIAMGQRPADGSPVALSVECVLPMPLSAARLAERGYNQSALLAREVGGLTGIPVDLHALLHPLETAHQAALTRAQRQQNLRGAFMVDPTARPRLAGRHVALVDDVVTTGATAAEATRELLRAGATTVQVWAVARTT